MQTCHRLAVCSRQTATKTRALLNYLRQTFYYIFSNLTRHRFHFFLFFTILQFRFPCHFVCGIFFGFVRLSHLIEFM